MIFQYTWEAVLGKSKTTTRRAFKEGEEAVLGPSGQIKAVTINGRVKWAVGKTYAVQPGRNEAQIARIELLSIHRERLHDISDEGAVAEGYANREAFLAAWQQINGSRDDQSVWALAFRLIDR